MHKFLKSLQDNAFNALSIEGDIDLQGWLDPSLINVVKGHLARYAPEYPLVILEVGSWKGCSANELAKLAKEKKFSDVAIVCIDTWLGAPEFWTERGLKDASRGLSLDRHNGYPQVFYRFTTNMKLLGHDDIICPFPISSEQAVVVLSHYGITADIIYIDASHEYDAVKRDIEQYKPLLRSGGLMLGDDFSSAWPGVMKAVREQGAYKLNGRVWSIEK